MPIVLCLVLQSISTHVNEVVGGAYGGVFYYITDNNYLINFPKKFRKFSERCPQVVRTFPTISEDLRERFEDISIVDNNNPMITMIRSTASSANISSLFTHVQLKHDFSAVGEIFVLHRSIHNKSSHVIIVNYSCNCCTVEPGVNFIRLLQVLLLLQRL